MSALRWKLWRLVSVLPRTCPAHAHSLIIEKRRRNPMQDAGCEPCAHGCCWCGKIQREIGGGVG